VSRRGSSRARLRNRRAGYPGTRASASRFRKDRITCPGYYGLRDTSSVRSRSSHATRQPDQPRRQRSWIAMPPGQLAFLFSAYQLSRAWPDRPALAEAMSFVAGGWMLGGISLVSQIYQLDSRPPNGIWLWLVLVLPAAWLLERRAVAAVIFIALVWGFASRRDRSTRSSERTGSTGPGFGSAFPCWLPAWLPFCLHRLGSSESGRDSGRS